MPHETITFRLDAEKRKALDAIAAGLERDRSYVLNEAIRSYLETYRWQLEHVREGIRQADAGLFASPSQVRDSLARWRKNKRR